MSNTFKNAQNRLSAVAATITGVFNGESVTFPPFDELPKVESEPQGCLWGFFDKDGKKDECGMLNVLTPSLVLSARNEIQTGTHIQLDWPLHNLQFPVLGRQPLSQRKIDLKESFNFISMDDELHFNTQSGSQWDSLKHFGHQKTGKYYNGLTHEEARSSDRNGIHNWCERGGIVGRGVLVDWLAWYEQKNGVGSAPSAVSRHEIPLEEVEETLKWQGTTLKFGDVLMLRSGYVRWHNQASTTARKSGTQENNIAIGLRASEEAVRWLYSHHFAAVVGDTVAFEAWPPAFDGWCLHEWLLTQWGTPIGELWDLEKLSETCKEKKRYTFFLTSAPLHVRGGVGSPPGAIAIL
ncbi:hypothetical protein P154DRAFT_485524 [Amniculicola lignicola CBS 123094]|uniref:Cyclase n=1 Tax=Amniculicola lignicola CBS 123094 TaxID=1392246 RepID=A0A6A5WTR5_9PLEO|nr:hypothetical protein P154DRAFT_485524 [Amniculicola lignicola CBS 123094]